MAPRGHAHGLWRYIRDYNPIIVYTCLYMLIYNITYDKYYHIYIWLLICYLHQLQTHRSLIKTWPICLVGATCHSLCDCTWPKDAQNLLSLKRHGVVRARLALEAQTIGLQHIRRLAESARRRRAQDVTWQNIAINFQQMPLYMYYSLCVFEKIVRNPNNIILTINYILVDLYIKHIS